MRADTANWGLSLVVGSRRSGHIMRAPGGVYTRSTAAEIPNGTAYAPTTQPSKAAPYR